MDTLLPRLPYCDPKYSHFSMDGGLAAAENHSEPEIDHFAEALVHYVDHLPPFIQDDLDTAIDVNTHREVFARNSLGTWPSLKSMRKDQLVCRAWDNLNNRFWTYDKGGVRYIVKAFPTNAIQESSPKILYRVWDGVGAGFLKTPAAFDFDDSIYYPHNLTRRPGGELGMLIPP